MAVNRLNVGATNQLLSKASSGQSTNILELQNTAGTTVAGVDASGNPVGTLIHPPTFKNLIINGAMQVAQRGTSVASITTSSYNTADRWTVYASSLGTWTQTVENDAPTGSGFRKSLKMLCTTADASPSANDSIEITQILEGQNLQQILKGTSSAKQLTMSFWVKANVTGTYTVWLYDGDNARAVAAQYTISASATWEKKTITFAADTTGAFDNDNAASLYIRFGLGFGSGWTSGTLASSWQSYTQANVGVGQVNVGASTNNYWQITGVQLEVGSVATDYEFLPIDAELVRCRRYCQRYDANENQFIIPSGFYFDANNTRYILQFDQQMRGTPSLTFYGTANTDYYVFNNAGQGTGFSFSSERANSRGIIINGNKTSHGITNSPSLVFAIATTSGYLILSAEL